MLINKHNHNSRHSQLPRTPRRHQTHPSASRHALSSDQVSAEITSKNMFYIGLLLPTSVIFFLDILVQKRKCQLVQVISENMQKDQDTVQISSKENI